MDWPALAWRLRSYAVHDDDCKINKPPHFRDCSCGLKSYLDSMEEQNGTGTRISEQASDAIAGAAMVARMTARRMGGSSVHQRAIKTRSKLSSGLRDLVLAL